MVTSRPALDAFTTSVVVWNSSAIWVAADMRDVLLKQAVIVTKLVMKTTRHFCAFEALYLGECSSRSSIELAGEDLEEPFSSSGESIMINAKSARGSTGF